MNFNFSQLVNDYNYNIYFTLKCIYKTYSFSRTIQKYSIVYMMGFYLIVNTHNF